MIYLAANTLWQNQWNKWRQQGGWNDLYSYFNMVLTSFGFVWFGDDRWNGPEWTLSVELWGSFLVFLTVVTLYQVKNRYAFYSLITAFFLLGQIQQDENLPKWPALGMSSR